MKKYKVLFVYAHPDDESLWTGGTLQLMSRFDFIENYVLVLSGAKDERYKEFENAITKIKPTNHLVLSQELAKTGGVMFQDPTSLLQQGISTLGLETQDIDLIISHSYYGDEHGHIQHKQAFSCCLEYCKSNTIPFAFFSPLLLPNVYHLPILPQLKRFENNHLVNLSKCIPTEKYKVSKAPCFLAQYRVDAEKKKDLLECYQSIDVVKHQKTYDSWDNCVENYYFLDQKAILPFIEMNKKFTTPSRHKLFF